MAIEIPSDWPDQEVWVRDTPVGHLETVTVGSSDVVTRTNLHPKPSVEVDANGWESNSAFGAYDVATVARSTLRAWVGTASVLVTTPAPVTGETWGNYTSIPVVNGGIYTYSAYVWSPVDAVFYADVVFVAQGPDTFVPAQTWTRVSVTFVSNTTGAFTGVGISGAPAGFQYHIDGALLEKARTLEPYFDGSFPDVTTPGAEVDYSWLGAANASASRSVAVTPNVPYRWPTASWSTTREMQASSLPGQARSGAGLSIGTGKALVKRDSNDYPWKQSLVFELTGQDAQILIAPENRTKIPTGQFQVAEVSGDLTTLGVQVDLDERTIQGKDKTPGVQLTAWYRTITQDEVDSKPFDPVWLVSELAAQMGYTSGNQTPGADGYTPLLDVPFHGSLQPAYPINTPYRMTDPDEPWTWRSFGGNVGLSPAADANLPATPIYALGATLPVQFAVTADIGPETWLTFRFQRATGNGLIEVRVQNVGATGIRYGIRTVGSNGTQNAWTMSPTVNMPRDPETPYRVQAEVFLTTSGRDVTAATIQVRRSVDQAWSPSHGHSMPNVVSRWADGDVFDAVISAETENDIIANFSVVDSQAVSQTVRNRLLSSTGGSQGRIYLEPLLGTDISPWLDPELSVWATMQAIVEAWQGALITDVYGDLKVLNRLTLTGANVGQDERVVDVGMKFEDLPWQMNWSDQADRLVVRYRPVQEVLADSSQVSVPTIWELQEVLPVDPGLKEFFFTLDYIYPVDIEVNHFVRKDFDNGINHVWDAYRYNNGTGAHMDPSTDIQMRVDPVSSATWKLIIRNLTSSPFYMLDNSGTPWLKFRSTWYYDQTAEAVIERGVAAGDSKSALEVDLGHYVQNEADAIAITDFLWGRLNQRSWRAATVNAIPDHRLDLGDVVELQHARTGMRSNAIVTKVELAGEPGSVTQKIDLTLIPQTWADFDEQWGPGYHTSPPGSWDEFDALWANYTWDDFDRTPAATTVAEIEEAM